MTDQNNKDQHAQQITESMQAIGRQLTELNTFLEKKYNLPILAKLRIVATALVVGIILFSSKAGLIFKLISASLFGALIWCYFYLGLTIAIVSLVYWLLNKLKGT
jgi:ABC-type transport system involved in cytochrome bd biosynthesis fused ATPase/permease subunit